MSRDIEITRRSLARGAAWATPAVAVAAAAPAMAVSGLTATGVTPYEYQTIFSRTPTSCNTSTNPQKGYIDTLCCTSPVTPRNGDCNQNPTTSQGYWLEGNGGTAKINSISVTYTFNTPVVFYNGTYAGTANTSGTSTWTETQVLNPGWTITSTTSTSITLTFSGSGAISTSTSTDGSGFCTGYFIPFRVTGGCYASGSVKVSTAITMTYSDSVNNGKTWTKNVSAGI